MAGKPVWGLRKMVDFSLPLHIVLPGADKRKIHFFNLFATWCLFFFLKKKKKKYIYIYIYIFFFNIYFFPLSYGKLWNCVVCQGSWLTQT